MAITRRKWNWSMTDEDDTRLPMAKTLHEHHRLVFVANRLDPTKPIPPSLGVQIERPGGARKSFLIKAISTKLQQEGEYFKVLDHGEINIRTWEQCGMSASHRRKNEQFLSLNCEVAVFSGASGLEAQDLGAKRIELNAPGSYEAGGKLVVNRTPDGRSLQGTLAPRCWHSPVKGLTSIASQLEIAVRIMIRPRGPPRGQGMGNW
ncbi:hypothetical protein TRIATDRAFT_320031 [Trichoderma atroviride IMI 206040]|uniref:Uncharacterized protein n=1 Tax=Hypocrea atroviridis (strain ATCC 20476 / IMI 206040) TaxID=452589 RepID=G9P2C0_HYPAI|nr:uncharacterized protein TRIATDRAFT_320031 [Trichoderma atroviride IMI 206040]EHK42659.1 hypothetical protein TRIATDRAFT_320031 [Trichoderma atroviride IMI 206040]